MSQDADSGATDVMTDAGNGDTGDISTDDTWDAGTTDDANTSDDTTDTGDVSDDTTDTGDTSDDTTDTGDVSDDTTDTGDVSDDTTDTGDVSDDTTDTGDVSDDSTDTSDDTTDTSDSTDTGNTSDDTTDTTDTTDTSDTSDTTDAGTSANVDYKSMVAIPSGINSGVSAASQATMMSALGNPGTPQDSCGTPSAALQKLMKTASVGPFRVTGLVPAVDALTRVFAAVKSAKPDLYAVLGTAGMLCVRHVRGSTTNFSNHSWGTAIDITIGGQLTPRGSTTVQQGLVDLAPFMEAERFFWGAAFPTPDGMHFEASNELITDWKSSNTIP